jgi:proline dehydrogenase
LFSKATLAVAHSGPVEKVFTQSGPGRAVARRFVAGETLDDAVEVAKRLNGDGLSISLDLLGEEVYDRDTALAATDAYVESLERIDIEGLDANISIKPTQLGLAIDEELALAALVRLGDLAAELGTTVTIDMEDSRYTEATIRLFEKGQAATGNFGIALQSYLRRTPKDLGRLVPLGGHIRLCKGAYVEPEEVALQAKSGVDAAFARQLRTLMESDSTKPAIATHDPRLLDLTLDLAAERDGPFEFQMLYGVRTDLQRQLIGAGFPVRVYLPFGSQWYPYLTRRLAERPANAWFLFRALLGS